MTESAPEPTTSVSLLGRLRAIPLDQAAWRLFAEAYGPVLYAWCRRWRLQEADAADVMQSVFLKCTAELQRLDYDPARSFRGWLRTIAHHAWQDLVTNRQRVLASSGRADLLDTLEAPDDLAAELEAAFDQELVAMALARVRLRVQPATWEAFRLTALDGLSGEEAASRLGMKLTSVYKAKSNLLKKLQAEICSLESDAIA